MPDPFRACSCIGLDARAMALHHVVEAVEKTSFESSQAENDPFVYVVRIMMVGLPSKFKILCARLKGSLRLILGFGQIDRDMYRRL